MPTLTVNLAYDAPDSGVELDDDLDITVQALDDVVREDAGVTYVINPWPLKLSLVNGQGAIDLAAGYYWVHHPWGSKLVSLQADARLDQLDAIDPATLDPDEPMSPAWQAMLDALGDRVTQLEEAGVGEPGPPGDPGPEGPSAYEVAVAAGFAGDEAAWLASLKGADGEDGAAGGLKVYANEAEVDAEDESTTGMLYLDDWGAYTELTELDAVAGYAFIVTTMNGADRVQTAQIGNTSASIVYRLRRFSSFGWGLEIPPASKAPTANTLAQRQSDGTLRIGTPTSNDHAATKQYVDGAAGLKVYADEAAFTAETQTVMGILSPATNWGAFTGITSPSDRDLSGHSGPALVQTVKGIVQGIAATTQFITISERNPTYIPTRRLTRRRVGNNAWQAWTYDNIVPRPVVTGDAANKAYVDERALIILNSFADLGNLQGSSQYGYVYPGADLAAETGIAKYAGLPGDSNLAFRHDSIYYDVDYHRMQTQSVWVSLPDGSVDEIRRYRKEDAGWVWEPWSAWTLYVPGTSAATADTIVKRDAGGRFRAAAPSNSADVTNKSYVDNRFTFSGTTSWQNTAALDAYDLDSAQGAISNGIADMGAYTGLSAYNGLFVGIPLVEHYAGSAYPKLAMVQRLKFTDADGNFVIIQRKKTRLAPAAWSTWSAWVIV